MRPVTTTSTGSGGRPRSAPRRGRRDTPTGAAAECGRPAAYPPLDVTIERIVPGGAGLAHAEGRTIFVPLTAPGDRVRIQVERQQGSVLHASVMEVMESSPERVEPPCPIFGRCGGCDFQHLSYDAQLRAKTGIVRDCLRRIGGIDLASDPAIVPSPLPLAYRTRAEWHTEAATRRVGYLARLSATVVDAPTCPILVPALNTALGQVRAAMEGDDHRESPAQVTAAAGDSEASWAASQELGRSALPELTVTIGSETYRFDAGCFFQVNQAILPRLVDEVMRGHEPAEPPDDRALALDLYCGVGLFTLPLARRFPRVIGVESHARSAGFARRNLREAGLGAARVKTDQVDRWLRSRAGRLDPVHSVLLDPPRSGLEPSTIASLVLLAPERITYISCDPATLARDLKALVNAEAGYRVERVTAFDMFPQTHHVETVVHLVR